MALIPFRTQQPEARRSESPFQSLQREMNHLINGFFSDLDWSGEAMGPSTSQMTGLQPRVDVAETAKEYTITCELPGVEEKDIELSVSNNTLTVRGEKRSSHSESGESMTRIERTYGSFFRSIPLWEEIAEDKVEAKFKKGVLHIVAPKSPQAASKTKRISIKSA